MMRRVLLASTVCALALGTAGCLPSLAAEDPGPVADGGTYIATAAAAARLGQGHQWHDGMRVELSTPSPLTGVPVLAGQRAVQLTLVITNGTRQPLRTALARLNGTYTELGSGAVTQAEPLVNRPLGIGIGPDTPDVAPGATQRLRIAFAVGAQPGTLLVRTSPDLGIKYQDVTFSGEV
ncbi:hypothetical protein JOF53_004627 [Crossiella equi]|uniref:DUF4352 domain-containing protein n=1 Tax=Crossiella equi TaxID=130796 RepID=A0ABS5AGR2_9PSEU|nr:hypothetical protein [Crossiella equi]MBP2475755.1 hypothetical protein [Crossiella equi]